MSIMDEELIYHASLNNLNGVIESLVRGANVHAHYDCALWWGATNAQFDVTHLLLEHGANANVNMYSGSEETVLSATVQNYLYITSLLCPASHRIIKNCAPFSIRKDIQVTKDTENDYLKTIAKLLEYGANIYVKDGYILKQIHTLVNFEHIPEIKMQIFEKDLADVILPYCQSDDYCYFPDSYIKENVVAMKRPICENN